MARQQPLDIGPFFEAGERAEPAKRVVAHRVYERGEHGHHDVAACHPPVTGVQPADVCRVVSPGFNTVERLTAKLDLLTGGNEDR